MNARYSPQVTGRSHSAKPRRNRRWRGPSLSNAKPRPSCPTPTNPPAQLRKTAARTPATPARAPPPRPAPRRGEAGEAGRALRGPGGARAARRAVRRPQRVRPERMFDVGEDQLLVLLLVVQAKLDGRRQRGAGVPAREQELHRLVDVLAV